MHGGRTISRERRSKFCGRPCTAPAVREKFTRGDGQSTMALAPCSRTPPDFQKYRTPGLDNRYRLFLTRRRLRTVEASGNHVAKSEEHTSELQSLTNLVCRLLLEKKKKKTEIYKID